MASTLSSLGRFFGGGAGGVAQRLGGMAGRGISAFTGGASRAAAGAGSALGRGIAGLGTTSGRTGMPRIIKGAVNAPRPDSQDVARSTFGRGPGTPATYSRASYGGAGGGGGGVATGSWQDSMAAMQSRRDALQERVRVDRANKMNVSAYNKAFASANAANESRYQQLLGIADATTGQRAKDITSDFEGQQASAMQNLAGLGLANTSGASTIRGGFGRKKNAALDRLADQMQQTKLGIIERRTDQIPDLASLVSLGRLGISGLKF